MPLVRLEPAIPLSKDFVDVKYEMCLNTYHNCPCTQLFESFILFLQTVLTKISSLEQILTFFDPLDESMFITKLHQRKIAFTTQKDSIVHLLCYIHIIIVT